MKVQHDDVTQERYF